VVLARELTKTFETVLDGEVDELILLLDSDLNQSKGEFVLMISGASKNKDELSCQAKILAIKLVEHLPKKQVAKLVAETFEEKRNAIYQFLLEQT
jgi:16S rRNA (cytidine1402-2'-O)-methyltransferase